MQSLANVLPEFLGVIRQPLPVNGRSITDHDQPVGLGCFPRSRELDGEHLRSQLLEHASRGAQRFLYFRFDMVEIGAFRQGDAPALHAFLQQGQVVRDRAVHRSRVFRVIPGDRL